MSLMQQLNFGTAVANDGETLASAFDKIQTNFDLLDTGVATVGVTDLTAGTNTTAVKTANTAAIQAAIDAAYAAGAQVIQMPAGVYYCDPGIYLDPPGNLRASLTTPTNFNFSLHLRGAGGLHNNNSQGTQLLFTDNTTTALIVGPGQGMRVSDLSIIGPSGTTSRAAYPANGIGIGLAGGSGGLSRCLLDGVGVINFRVGYKTGFNGNANLCDSVTLLKCVCFDCHTGIHFSQTQNYINTMVACDFGGNKIHVLSDVAKAVTIIGGNYSTANTFHAAFTIGTVSTLSTFTDSTQIGDAPFTNASFTCVVTSPGQPFIDGAYDAFVIDDSEFGPIALRLLSFDSGTSTATLCLYAWWLLGSGFNVNFAGDFGTRLQTRIQAATTLYAAETITTFKGLCFDVSGVHVENPECVTTLFHMTSGFGGDDANRFNRITFNFDLDQASLHGGAANNEAVFLCQQAFPFIHLQGYNDLQGNQDQAVVEFSNIGTAETSNRILIDAIGRNRHRLIVRGCDFKPNLRTLNFTGGDAAVIDKEVAQRGFGEWDECPFFAAVDTSQFYSRRKLNGIPFEGYYPSEHAQLTIRASELSDIDDGLGAAGTYPVILGRRPYLVNTYDAYDTVSGVNAARYIESDHFGWSYGQNLTIDWDYVAGTNVLRLSSTTSMFAGLRITLDNGGGDVGYVVTGVYPDLEYVTVMRHGVGSSRADLAGTAGTQYTGSTVKQDSYSFSRVGFLPPSKIVANATVGATTAAAGDLTGAEIVDLTLSAVGSANYTTRTATQMFGDISGAFAGLTYHLIIKNTSSGATTVVAGSGVTLTGTATIAPGSIRMFSVTFPSATTATITSRFSPGDIADAGDVILRRDDAATLAQRNGTTAQITRGYRTFSDASNYERWALQSGAGYFELAAETAGTGTDNIDLRLTAAGTGKVSTAFPFAAGTNATDRVTINGFYMSPANVVVAVPSIANDAAENGDSVDVDVSGAFSMQPAVGDAVIAIPQEALPTDCLLCGAYVTATDTITVTFMSKEGGGGVTGANRNFKFMVFDLT